MSNSSFKCEICGRQLKSEQGVRDHTNSKHSDKQKARTRKRKISSESSALNLNVTQAQGSQVIQNLVLEKGAYLNPPDSNFSSKPPSEPIKRRRVSSMLDLLAQKAQKSPVKFVVDVDNIGAVESICSFFSGFDVHVTFFVKNQLGLRIPAEKSNEIPFDIVLVDNSDDDDFAALTLALNLDAFIISCDKYRTYLESGLVDSEWLASHRIECSWKKAYVDGKESSSIIPSIPLRFLPQAQLK